MITILTKHLTFKLEGRRFFILVQINCNFISWSLLSSNIMIGYWVRYRFKGLVPLWTTPKDPWPRVLSLPIPDPVSRRCLEPRVDLLETIPRWHATIYYRLWWYTMKFWFTIKFLVTHSKQIHWMNEDILYHVRDGLGSVKCNLNIVQILKICMQKWIIARV